MSNNLHYKFVKPVEPLANFVDGFWLLHNLSESDKDIVVLPDGRIDLILSQSPAQVFRITFLGIGTHPEQTILTSNTLMFAISFKLLATEYVFHSRVSGLLNSAENMPAGFWNFSSSDLNDFDLFCKKASRKLIEFIPAEMDERKRKLFELIYSSKGSLSVKELSEKAFWSSRQINRYFNQQYGISLKAYCNILRFRASLHHIAYGKLFPEEDFVDQAHFIKEVKKFSGVVPKELSKNKNDRFILLSTLRKK